MKVIDRILDFPNADWGEDRIFICENTVGVIDVMVLVLFLLCLLVGIIHKLSDWQTT